MSSSSWFPSWSASVVAQSPPPQPLQHVQHAAPLQAPDSAFPPPGGFAPPNAYTQAQQYVPQAQQHVPQTVAPQTVAPLSFVPTSTPLAVAAHSDPLAAGRFRALAAARTAQNAEDAAYKELNEIGLAAINNSVFYRMSNPALAIYIAKCCAIKEDGTFCGVRFDYSDAAPWFCARCLRIEGKKFVADKTNMDNGGDPANYSWHKKKRKASIDGAPPAKRARHSKPIAIEDSDSDIGDFVTSAAEDAKYLADEARAKAY